MASRKDSKGRALREGETQRSDGRYCYRYNGLEGKRKYIYAKDLNELRQKEKQIQKDIEDHIYSNNVTMNECFDRYMETKNDLREGTRHRYNLEYNRWIRDTWFGRKCIKDIKKSDVLLFYKEKSKTLSDGTIRCMAKYIYPALEMAVDDDLIRKNPSKDCAKDYSETKVRKAVSSDDIVKMLDFAEQYDYGKEYLLAVKIMLGTGLRVGETVGLTWNDLDFNNRQISVNKQFTLIAGGGRHEYHISAPKTDKGNRLVPMSEDVMQMLKDHREATYFRSLRYGVHVDGYSGFVFHTRSGLPILPNRINDYFARLIRDYNNSHEDQLPKMSCHSMRHTFCTRMAELGMNPKSLQYIMGHSSYKITSDVYITENADYANKEFRKIIG